jgi:O-antigen/teichoic acid export membrane protein
LQSEFIHLVYLQCGVVALSFATRVFSLILSAHQRMDLVNYTGILSLMVNFAALWLFFHFGFGVLSLAWAALCATVTVVVCQWLACEVFKLFPGRGGWGRASWSSFKEIFAFGKDVFLVSVGTQFIMASQIIVITRMLGLEAAAIWSVGLRVFSLVSQVIWRISDMSGPAFAEMMVRGETSRLRERYATVAVLTASLSGFAAISFALCNSLFIPVWTHGKIQWPMTNNLLLGIWMILLAVLHCHNTFVLLTKKVGLMRYVYFVEGVVFVSLSILVARRGGLPAIIACSIVCSAMFSGAYGVRRISRYFNLPLGEVGWNWFRPMGRMLLFYLPVAVLVWWLPGSLPGIVRLAFNAALAVSVGGYFLLRYGIPLSFQDELLGRVPARFGSLLKHIFVQPAK